MATFGTIATGYVLPKGGAMTVTRNATEFYGPGPSGEWASAAVNALGVTSAGPWIGGAYTEALLQTDTMLTAGAPATATAPWTAGSGGVAAPGLSIVSEAGPDGSTVNAFRLAFSAVTGANQWSVFYQSFTGSAVPWTTSWFVRAATPCTTYATLWVSGTGSEFAISGTTSWQRLPVTKTLTAATWYLLFGPDTRANGGVQPTSQAACTLDFWRPNATATPVMMPAVAAASSPVAQPGVTIQVANPLSGTTPPDWAFAIRATCPVWGGTVNGGFFSTAGGANAASMYWASSTLLNVDTYDGSNVRNTEYATISGLANNSEHTIIAASSNGALKIYLDGVALATTHYGASTSPITHLAAVQIGTQVAAGYKGLDCTVKRFKICKTSNPARCQP
jgi:hypothetical protein